MIECEIITKKRGNSLGFVFPKEVVKTLNLKENQKVNVIILSSSDTLRKTDVR